ncbi:serine/threonine-protein kinase VRK1-like [Rhipicephalus microplus]|uniref:serine/threonine-protein kinase VRK1-like n=1 Tax=Rhipicephalus microplus TaxID=6941 RepID=UPI003F6CF0EB
MHATEEGLKKIFHQQRKILPLKTAFSFDKYVSDGLEYVHSYEYTHSYVKPSRLLHGFSKGNENNLYLVDAAIFRVPTSRTRHQKCKEDLRKVNDGTTVLATREARPCAHPRNGAVELLGLFQWLCCRWLREDDVKRRKFLCQQKSRLIEEVRHLMSKWMPHGIMQCSMNVPALRGYKALPGAAIDATEQDLQKILHQHAGQNTSRENCLQP